MLILPRENKVTYFEDGDLINHPAQIASKSILKYCLKTAKLF